ncbi:MAG: LacI family DNA-binding transcriptional regulator, partial [Wenzhouxiangellaceae bacterium]
MSKVTIDDVARLAGVSIKTVSRVVNREPNVRESTRGLVEKAIAELRYRPNQSARNLASHRSHLIGLIYDDPSAYEVPSSGYIIRLQQGMLRACNGANYELLIHPCRYERRDVVRELLEVIEQVRPAGMVIAAPLSNTPRIVRAIEATGTPFVRLSPGETNGKQFSVATNDRQISAEMVRYLASLGHRRIAFIKGNPKHKAVGKRFLGYNDGLKDSGIAFSNHLVCDGDNSIGSGEACAQKLLQQQTPPTAIFAANDDMAAGVMRIAAKRGIRIPEQLSVAGCDDISLARQIHPMLTTIRQPLSEMAERAALALIDEARSALPKRGTEIFP